MELFWSGDIDSSNVIPGESLVRLDEEESVHCVRVLRHRAGDEISVIDGRGSLYRCTLVEADARCAVSRVESVEPGFGAHPYSLTMAVCPTKNADRFEWFAEKATEIGVDVIAPVVGEHSERKVLNTGRVRRLVLSAAKQSLKGSVPEVLEPQSVLSFIENAPSDALKLICCCFDDGEQRISVSEALAGFEGGHRRVVVLIGPEGDFSPSEAAIARSCGWKAVHLGDSRLRTETAALVAVTSVYLRFIVADNRIVSVKP